MLASGYGRGLGVFAKEYASDAQMLEGVKVLVEHHADVNATNENLQTPMHFAVQASDDIVRYLAAHGAKLDAKDKAGRTPIDVAMGAGVRGRAGEPPPPRTKTAALLRQLQGAQ